MKDKIVLVTGAASGLGRETALAQARAGAGVCIVDLNEDGLQETAAQVQALGGAVHVRADDLADPGNCKSAVGTAVQTFGRLDALCNVAGVHKFTHSTEMSVADWNRILAVNLSAPFFLSQAAIPHLLEAKGAIVNVASAAAINGEPYSAAYCASKAGLTHLTRSMAVEYMHEPLRINSIAPSGMMTGMGATVEIPDGADPRLLARFKQVRGLVEVADVAQMIVLLCSDAGRGIHGACISMDHGATAG